MGDTYLLPAIAAVVAGGTNILSRPDRYLGTLFRIMLIVLNSVLPIMQMSEAVRQIIHGRVIIAMLLGPTFLQKPFDRRADSNQFERAEPDGIS